MSTTTKQGNCPACGSDEIDYMGVPEHYGNEAIADYEREEIEYVFECSDCGQRFQEVYRLVYLRTEAVN
ncbi:MAG: hypothetical protein EPN82_13455 [Bacteroidetes bacterium]|nr:MAG: hypothetical protein EPN82_13455 [Bacteroidota bacterium]